MSINLNDYHLKIKEFLESDPLLSVWFKNVTYYPEVDFESGKAKKLKAPFLFFSVDDWEKSDKQPEDGRKKWDLNLTFYVGVNGVDDSLGKDNRERDYQVVLRDLAMGVCTVLDGSFLGIKGPDKNVNPVQVVTAQPDGFQTELDDYEIYSINAKQPFFTGSLHDDLEALKLYKPTLE